MICLLLAGFDSHCIDRFFFTSALALKLYSHMNGDTTNVDLHSLYEKLLQQNIPVTEWESWIRNNITSK